MTALVSSRLKRRFSECFARAVTGTLFEGPLTGRAGPPGCV